MHRWGYLFLYLTICFGCGQRATPRGTIRGKVTLDGRPISSAVIVFENLSQGISQSANLAADGTYEMRTHEGAGIVVGEYHVAIRPGTIGTGEVPLVANPKASPIAPSDIPDRYQHPATSQLTVTVVEGNNVDADFELTK